MKRSIIMVFLFATILIVACSEGTFTFSPSLDNKWDTENPDYASLPEIPRDDLLAEYLFDGTTEDTSGNGLDCTGTVGTFLADRLENASSALAFNGEDEYLSVPDVSLGTFLVNGTTTISFWFRTNVSGGFVFGCSAYRDGGGWSLKTGSYGLLFSTGLYYYYSNAVGEEIGTYDTIDITDGVWHHIIMMNDGFTINFYVDGELYTTFSTSNIGYKAEEYDYFFIGAVYDNYSYNTDVLGDFFAGALDNLRIYGRNLTQDEINALFLEGRI